MANEFATNLSGSQFFYIWHLIRRMKKAGWKVLASSNGNAAKDTSGSPSADLWGMGFPVNHVQVGAQAGAAASSGAATTSGLQTITGVTGFTAASVGRFLSITGAFSAVNNRLCRIVSQTGTTVTVYNNEGTSDANNGALSWSERRGGTGASITAVVSGPDGNIATITGLSGLVSAAPSGGNSEGRLITISGAATGANNQTGQIIEILSGSSCKALMPNAVAGDVNNGAIEWTESDPSQDYYPTSFNSKQPWIVLEGPPVVQLMYVTTPGLFLRGEGVTQTGTGATGELVGSVWDPVTATGWAIIRPRTGAFNSSGVLNGDLSAATATPNAIRTYKREWVWAKSSTGDSSSGGAWYGVFRQDTEAAYKFSALATNVNCTAVVPPGGANVNGNRISNSGFTYGFIGNNQTWNASTVGYAGGFFTATGTVGRCQIGVVNAFTGRSGRSADGSWFAFTGSAFINRGYLLHQGIAEDLSPGEAEHYYTYRMYNTTGGGIDQWIANLDGGSTVNGTYGWYDTAQPSTSANFFCWKRIANRADKVGQATPGFTYFYPCFLANTTLTNDNGGMAFTIARPNSTFREYNHPAAIAPLRRHPYFFHYSDFGRARWLYVVNPGSGFDTYDGKTFIQLSPTDPTNRIPGTIIGPWDGQTVPLQS